MIYLIFAVIFIIAAVIASVSIIVITSKPSAKSSKTATVQQAYAIRMNPYGFTLLTRNIKEAFAIGGTTYAMFVEQEYKKVKLPGDPDGYINHTFAVMMNWFAIPLTLDNGVFITRNSIPEKQLYVMLDFNIAMFVVFREYLFSSNGDQAELRDRWTKLYYRFLSNYCRKQFEFSQDELAKLEKLFTTRVTIYTQNHLTTADTIDTQLVEFMVRDYCGEPFLSVTPTIDYKFKAKLFDTVVKAIEISDKHSKKLIEELSSQIFN
jgi:hypothetical protein